MSNIITYTTRPSIINISAAVPVITTSSNFTPENQSAVVLTMVIGSPSEITDSLGGSLSGGDWIQVDTSQVESLNRYSRAITSGAEMNVTFYSAGVEDTVIAFMGTYTNVAYPIIIRANNYFYSIATGPWTSLDLEMEPWANSAVMLELYAYATTDTTYDTPPWTWVQNYKDATYTYNVLMRDVGNTVPILSGFSQLFYPGIGGTIYGVEILEGQIPSPTIRRDYQPTFL